MSDSPPNTPPPTALTDPTPSTGPTAPPVITKRLIAVMTLLIFLNLLNYADRSVLSAVESKMEPEFFPPGDQGWGNLGSGFWMGTLVTAFLVIYMLTAPIFGLLADRYNRWTIVALGVIGGGLASAGSGLATTFGILLIMRMLVGLSEAAYGPAAPTIISDLFPMKRRGLALSFFYMAIPVGSAIGYLYGGFMLSITDSWRPGFLWLLAPALVFGIACFFLKDPKRGQSEAGATPTTPPTKTATKADYLIMIKTPSYVYNCIGQTLMTFAIGGISFWMPRFFTERTFTKDPTWTIEQLAQAKRTTLASVNFTFGVIVCIGGIVATLLGGWLADRLTVKYKGAYLGMSGAAMIIGFPAFIATLYAPMPFAWAFLALAVFFIFLNTGPTNTALANVTHPSVRASAFALNIFIIHALGDAISPPLIGLIKDQSLKHQWFSIDNNADAMALAFLLVGAAIFASGIVWIIGAKHLEKDTTLAPSRAAP